MLSQLEISIVLIVKEIIEMVASMTQEQIPMLLNNRAVALKSIFNSMTRLSSRPSKKLIQEFLWSVFYSQEDLLLLRIWFPFLTRLLLLGCLVLQEVRVSLMPLLEIMPWDLNQVQRRTPSLSIGPKIRYSLIDLVITRQVPQLWCWWRSSKDTVQIFIGWRWSIDWFKYGR